MKLNQSQIELLRRALGLDDKTGVGTMYRNRYQAGPNHHRIIDCLAMVHGGIMEQHADNWFSVTPDGIREARAEVNVHRRAKRLARKAGVKLEAE